MSITTSTASTYFATHLKGSVWSALSDSQKAAALKMATDDICCRLGISVIDETSVYQVSAVYEQAVYLSENFDKLSNPDQLQSESIDGAGSQTYRQRKDALLAPRAKMFLDRLNGGAVRLGRG